MSQPQEIEVNGANEAHNTPVLIVGNDFEPDKIVVPPDKHLEVENPEKIGFLSVSGQGNEVERGRSLGAPPNLHQRNRSVSKRRRPNSSGDEQERGIGDIGHHLAAENLVLRNTVDELRAQVGELSVKENENSHLRTTVDELRAQVAELTVKEKENSHLRKARDEMKTLIQDLMKETQSPLGYQDGP